MSGSYPSANPGDVSPWPIEATLANKAADNPAEAQAYLNSYQLERQAHTNVYEQQLAQQQQYARQQLVAQIQSEYMQRATEFAKTPGGAQALASGYWPAGSAVLQSAPDAVAGYAQAGNNADAATNLKNAGEGAGAASNAGIQITNLPGVNTTGAAVGPITQIGVAGIRANAEILVATQNMIAQMNPEQEVEMQGPFGITKIKSGHFQSNPGFLKSMIDAGYKPINPGMMPKTPAGGGGGPAPSVLTDTDTSAQGGGGNPLLKPGANPDNLLPPGGVIKQGTQVLPATTPTAADRSPAGAARAGQTSLPPAPAAAQKPAAATTTNAIAGKEKLQNVVLANLDTYRQRMAPADYKDLMDGMARNGGKPIVEPNPTTGKLEVRGASGKRL